MSKKAENQTSGKAEAVEVPTAGSKTDVKAEENMPKVEAESGSIADIKDISAEISAKIRKGAELEAKQKKEDEKNGLSFEDEIKEDFKITENKSTNKLLIFGVVGLGAIGAFLYLKNRKREPNETQEKELNNGVNNSVTIDNNGMLKSANNSNYKGNF